MTTMMTFRKARAEAAGRSKVRTMAERKGKGRNHLPIRTFKAEGVSRAAAALSVLRLPDFSPADIRSLEGTATICKFFRR
jgi:hypothetical protein